MSEKAGVIITVRLCRECGHAEHDHIEEDDVSYCVGSSHSTDSSYLCFCRHFTQ